MKYRDFHGKKISQLGFGAMRLPVLDGQASNIDMKQTEEMIMYAYENGVNYYDSAYVYHNGYSEVAIGEIFKKNGIRDKINIATKFPTRGSFANEGFEATLDEQLKRLQTDHIDFYLIHGLDLKKWKGLKDDGILDFLDSLKTSSKTTHLGFSFHDSYDSFVEILNDFDWNFAQIQLNFMDIEFQAGIKGLEYADSKGIPLVIMEPLRGGRVLTVQDPHVIELKEKNGIKNESLAKTCLSFLFDRPEILTVLSGMQRLSDVKENVDTASETGIGELTQNQQGFLDELKTYLESKETVACTGCRYCVPECPQNIDIPQALSAYNDVVIYNSKSFNATQVKRRNPNIANCIECNNCTNICPQELEIPELLKKTRSFLEI